MTKLTGTLLILLCLSPAGFSQTTSQGKPQLPGWLALEFEEKAFWATANARLEILPDPDDESRWKLNVLSSVVDKWEQLEETFDPATGATLERSRLSRGKNKRIKSYEYNNGFLVRERRNATTDDSLPPQQWPRQYKVEVDYPPAAKSTPITSSYMLIYLAQRLQQQGLDQSLEVLVHTDLNFYRARLTSGTGPTINVDYRIVGKDLVRGKRDTVAVAVQVRPEGTLPDGDDFNLLGLSGQLILLFDHDSGLPLQVRGLAPRIGATEINLKSVTMRESQQ